MQKNPIPGTDLALSRLSFGGWLTLGGSVDTGGSLRLLHAAVDAGVNFLDLADVYADGGAEAVVGAFLRALDRDALVVSSKVFWPTSERAADRGLGRAHVQHSIDRTLRRLGTDRVDIYFCHREDPATPLLETVTVMSELVRAGKARAWGTSCWRPATLQQAWALAKAHGLEPPRVEQPPYNLLERWIEAEVLPAAAALGMGVVVWSPLAGGVLTGKYLDGVPAGSRGATSDWLAGYLTPAATARVRAFVALARELGLAPARLALAWVAGAPGITSAIQGATSVEQLRANLTAAELVLEPAVRGRLDRIFPPGRRPSWRRWLGRLLNG
jgi:aryl-alcohol dehydrogenase-like predicted oxidoreductase